MKTLFVTTTIADVQQLHDTLNDLQLQNSDINRSLPNQLSYVKRLSAATEVNAEAIANLSSIVKDNIIQSHDRFQEIIRDFVWIRKTN